MLVSRNVPSRGTAAAQNSMRWGGVHKHEIGSPVIERPPPSGSQYVMNIYGSEYLQQPAPESKASHSMLFDTKCRCPEKGL